MQALSLAIVIPLGLGERAWQQLLPQLASIGAQIKLVACTPEDLPTEADSRWLLAPRGRARQLNAGAAATDAEFLWFLHADSRLSADSVPALLRSLVRAPDALGYFDLRFDADGPPLMWLNSLGAWVRSRWLGLPFGDQGLFLSRRNWLRLGGFDEGLPSAEDHAFVWVARRAGIRLQPAGAALYTSARRYAERGWWRTTVRHLQLTFAQARQFSARVDQRPW